MLLSYVEGMRARIMIARFAAILEARHAKVIPWRAHGATNPHLFTHERRLCSKGEVAYGGSNIRRADIADIFESTLLTLLDRFLLDEAHRDATSATL